MRYGAEDVRKQFEHHLRHMDDGRSIYRIFNTVHERLEEGHPAYGFIERDLATR